MAGVVRGADLVAEIGDGVAREEAVDHHEVLRLEAPGDLGEALVHQPPPLSLAEEGVLGAEVEKEVRVVAVTGASVGTSRHGLLPCSPHDYLGGARRVSRGARFARRRGRTLTRVAVRRRRAPRPVAPTLWRLRLASWSSARLLTRSASSSGRRTQRCQARV